MVASAWHWLPNGISRCIGIRYFDSIKLHSFRDSVRAYHRFKLVFFSANYAQLVRIVTIFNRVEICITFSMQI